MNIIESLHNQIETLFKAQDELNAGYDCAEWREKRHPFSDYVWIETGELLEHHGGVFHYKKVEPNWPQVQLELVDILHFGLSIALMKQSTAQHWVEQILHKPAGEKTLEPNAVPYYGRMLAKAAVRGDFDVYAFARLVEACQMTFQELIDRYMVKYTLNSFRINNGQTRGTYRKIWGDGREDNEHLLELNERAKGDWKLLYNLLLATYDNSFGVPDLTMAGTIR
jgi:hypothetical protein